MTAFERGGNGLKDKLAHTCVYIQVAHRDIPMEIPP